MLKLNYFLIDVKILFIELSDELEVNYRLLIFTKTFSFFVVWKVFTNSVLFFLLETGNCRNLFAPHMINSKIIQ
jgi:hypothetical protein